MKVKTTQEIEQALLPVAQAMEVEIFEIVFKQGKNPSLTVYLDTEKEGGIDLDTCERFHNAIDAPLDELDPSFGESYTLNVSSLGADRPFVSDADFERHIGKNVEVKLASSVKGKKFFEGELVFYDGKTIRVKVSGKDTLTFDLKSVRKVSEAIEF